MDFAIFSHAGLYFLAKWLHFFFGIMWIGHLYYFNFTQGAFMGGTDAPTKSQVTRGLLPIALYWFRWGAMWTLVSGLFMLGTAQWVGFVMHSDWGIKICTGALFGILMWANVWFVIWPKQKIVMSSAEGVAKGGAADPQAAVFAPQVLLSSRTNTMFSIPMLFFMGAASHLPITMDLTKAPLYFILLLVLVGALEINSVKGKLGPMATVKGVITSGFVLAAIVYVMMEVVL